MTAREVLDSLTSDGITVKVDAGGVVLIGHKILPKHVEAVEKVRPELVEDLIERDEELKELFGRYNRALRRVQRFGEVKEDPMTYGAAFASVLGQISSLIQKILDAGYYPLRSEILNGFIEGESDGGREDDAGTDGS